MATPTIVYSVVDHVFLVCAGDNAPTDAEFKEMVEAVSTLDNRVTGMLVFAGSKNPSLKQRSKMVSVLRQRDLKVAMVRDSRLARGAITAIGWFVQGVKAFQEPDIDRALDHLNVEPRLAGRVLSMVRELQSTLVMRKSA